MTIKATYANEIPKNTKAAEVEVPEETDREE
jgi:hypothetical protein